MLPRSGQFIEPRHVIWIGFGRLTHGIIWHVSACQGRDYPSHLRHCFVVNSSNPQMVSAHARWQPARFAATDGQWPIEKLWPQRNIALARERKIISRGQQYNRLVVNVGADDKPFDETSGFRVAEAWN